MALALVGDRNAPASRARGMAVSAVRRLMLTDFRSYAGLRLETGREPVVLTGPNGAGKTNLLEALSFLAPGRGLRGARLADVDRAGAGPFAVAARLHGPDGPLEIGTGRAPEGPREKRLVRLDGLPVPNQAALAEIASVVWLTPAMDRLFTDGPEARRRFLDRLVMVGDPGHAGQGARYHHALRERSRLLRERRGDPAWLGALEGRAAAAGVAIAAARRQTVAGLIAALAGTGGPFPRPELALDGVVEGWLETSSALDAEARLADALAAGRGQDAETGATAIGPHRSDLLVRDAASGAAARTCSTGQQKALLVSIVLAEARRRAADDGRLPILLLDEVIAHLDPRRRAHLFDEILALDAQAWMTGTDTALFAPLGADAQFFNVDSSTVVAS
jgi:DNA replication and repair protein RecF